MSKPYSELPTVTVQAGDGITYMIGLCGIGAALILGVAMRLAALGGVVLLAFMWMASLPIKSNPFLDEHLIYALVLTGLALVHADRKIGLGTWWERLPMIGRP